mmetsp:Transcript_12082/g.30418  ORF Transcript_12082/g.30418 Transcript_12082/m.30418 type:complete len:284 (-) Transcript_12082:2118-2969(-)
MPCEQAGTPPRRAYVTAPLCGAPQAPCRGRRRRLRRFPGAMGHHRRHQAAGQDHRLHRGAKALAFRHRPGRHRGLHRGPHRGPHRGRRSRGCCRAQAGRDRGLNANRPCRWMASSALAGANRCRPRPRPAPCSASSRGRWRACGPGLHPCHGPMRHPGLHGRRGGHGHPGPGHRRRGPKHRLRSEGDRDRRGLGRRHRGPKRRLRGGERHGRPGHDRRGPKRCLRPSRACCPGGEGQTSNRPCPCRPRRVSRGLLVRWTLSQPQLSASPRSPPPFAGATPLGD